MYIPRLVVNQHVKNACLLAGEPRLLNTLCEIENNKSPDCEPVSVMGPSFQEQRQLAPAIDLSTEQIGGQQTAAQQLETLLKGKNEEWLAFGIRIYQLVEQAYPDFKVNQVDRVVASNLLRHMPVQWKDNDVLGVFVNVDLVGHNTL